MESIIMGTLPSYKKASLEDTRFVLVYRPTSPNEDALCKVCQGRSQQRQQASVTVHVPVLVETENVTTAQKRPASPL